MSRPALCVDGSTDIEGAARMLALSDMHQLVVVDGGGAAVGVVSTHDLLRALTGVPARHPATFPHWDETTETSWTDDWPLDEHAADKAPEGPGVLALVTGGAGRRGAIVWAEPSDDIRRRVRALTSLAVEEPTLAEALATGGLSFRATRTREEGDRARIFALLRDRLEHVPPPGAT
jgi:CBS domain-containing protein